MDDATIIIGGNAESFRTEMARAVQDAEHGFRRMHGTAGEANEKMLVSSHRVAHQISTVAGELIRGGGAADVFAAGLEGVERSLHLPLGALAGLGIAAIFAEQMGKAREEVQKLADELHNLSTDASESPRFKSLEDMNRGLEEMKKKIEELRTQDNFFKNPNVWLYEHIAEGAGNAKARREQELQEAREGQSDLLKGVVDRTNEGAGESEAKNRLGDFAAERAKLEREFDETKAKRLAAVGPQDDAKDLIDAMNRQHAADIEALNERESAAKRAVALEENIVAIKTKGRDVEVEVAEARLKAANDEANVAPDEKKAEATAKIHAAELELENARRSTAEKRKQLGIETEVASLVGSETAKRMRANELEREELERRASLARPDEQSAISRDLARNRAEARTLENSGYDEFAQQRRAEIESNTAGGTIEDQRKRLKDLIALTNQQINQNTGSGRPDEVQCAWDLDAALAAQNHQLDEINYAYQKQLEAASSQTDVLELQLDGRSSLAEMARTCAEYDERIAQALHEGKNELADQLEKQKQLNLEKQATANFLKTPAQRRAQREQDRTERRAHHTVEARWADEDDRVKRGVKLDARQQKEYDMRHGFNVGDKAHQPGSSTSVETFHATTLKVDNFVVPGEKNGGGR